jgi:hypothetical protein
LGWSVSIEIPQGKWRLCVRPCLVWARWMNECCAAAKYSSSTHEGRRQNVELTFVAFETPSEKILWEMCRLTIGRARKCRAVGFDKSLSYVPSFYISFHYVYICKWNQQISLDARFLHIYVRFCGAFVSFLSIQLLRNSTYVAAYIQKLDQMENDRY